MSRSHPAVAVGWCLTGDRSCRTPHHAVSFSAGKLLLLEPSIQVRTPSQKGILSKAGRSPPGCTWLKQWGRRRKRAISKHILQHQVCLVRTTFILTSLLLRAEGQSLGRGKKTSGLGIMEGADTQSDKLEKSTSSCFPCLGREGCCLVFGGFFWVFFSRK